MPDRRVNIWEPEAECMDREELLLFQFERLQATLNRVYKNVAFYKKRFDDMGFNPEDFDELDRLTELPFTTIHDLMDSYPYDMFAVPLKEVVRIQTSSAWGRKPIVIGYTRSDLHIWRHLAARVLAAGGVRADDVVQNSFAYGLFTGGLGLHYGAELIGASVIPASTGRTHQQVRIMEDYRTTVLLSTPSYALVLADELDRQGRNAKRLNLKYALLAGEPWTEGMRTEIEERLKVAATDNYGLSEVMGPGVAGECLERSGMHIAEGHFIAEIIEPGSGERLPAGSTGELVLTTLTREAVPLIRYRTGDLTSLVEEPCGCGRTLSRIARIAGRADDTVVVRGINVFPDQVERLLKEIGGDCPPFQLEVVRENHLDALHLIIEMTESLFFDKMSHLSGLVEEIGKKFTLLIGLKPVVKLVERGTIEKRDGEVRRVVDKRFF